MLETFKGFEASFCSVLWRIWHWEYTYLELLQLESGCQNTVMCLPTETSRLCGDPANTACGAWTTFTPVHLFIWNTLHRSSWQSCCHQVNLFSLPVYLDYAWDMQTWEEEWHFCFFCLLVHLELFTVDQFDMNRSGKMPVSLLEDVRQW